MIIIVEGPDCSGKSTLMKRLREADLNAQKVIRERPEVRFFSMLGGRTEPHIVTRRRTYELIYSHSREVVICERFHPISDQVYRSLDGGKRIFSPLEYTSIMASVQSSIVVYCRTSLHAARTVGHKPSGDDDSRWMEFVDQKLPEIYEAYDRTMTRLSLMGVRIIRYDWTDPWSLDLLKEHLPCAV